MNTNLRSVRLSPEVTKYFTTTSRSIVYVLNYMMEIVIRSSQVLKYISIPHRPTLNEGNINIVRLK